MALPLIPFFCMVKVRATEILLSSSAAPVFLHVSALAPLYLVTSCRQKGVFLVLREYLPDQHKKKNPMQITSAMASMLFSTLLEV